VLAGLGEKPLALSAGECDEMIAACRQHGVALMEAFMYRFHPRTEQVARLASDGTLGVIRFVRTGFTSWIQHPQGHTRFRPELGGGALYDLGCYAVNISRMFLGEPVEVFACGRLWETGIDEHVGAALRFGHGQVALLDCSLRLARRQEYEVVGTEARVVVPNAFVPGAGETEFSLVKGPNHTRHTVPAADQYQHMVEHFADAIASGTPVLLPPEDAVRNLGVITALLASLKNGRPQSVPA
jgi:predicted dehydrogenase